MEPLGLPAVVAAAALLLVLPPIAAKTAAPCLDSAKPVECFLATQGVSLPGPLTVVQDGIELNVSAVHCTAVLSTLGSQLTPGGAGTPPSLRFHVASSRATCTATLVARGERARHRTLFRGNASITLDAFAMEDTVALLAPPPPPHPPSAMALPTGIAQTACSTSGHVASIHIVWGQKSVPRVLDELVALAADRLVRTRVCGALGDVLEHGASAALANASARLEPFTQPPLPIIHPPPADPERYVDLRSDEFAAVVDYVVDTLLGMGGLLSLNILGGILSMGTGRLGLAFDAPPFPLPPPAASDLKILFESVAVSNVSAWSELAVAEATAQDTTFRVGIETLDVALAFRLVNLSDTRARGRDLPTSTPATPLWHASVSLRNASLVFVAHAALVRDRFERLTVEQTALPSCWLAAADALDVSGVDLAFRDAHVNVTMDGSAEPGLDELASDAADWVVDALGDALPPLLSWAAEHEADELNAFLAARVGGNASTGCVPIQDPRMPIDTTGLAILWASLGYVCLLPLLWLCLRHRTTRQPLPPPASPDDDKGPALDAAAGASAAPKPHPALSADDSVHTTPKEDGGGADARTPLLGLDDRVEQQRRRLAAHCSLMLHDGVPWHAQVVPPLVLGCLPFIFYAGVTQAAARLQVFLELPGRPRALAAPDIYEINVRQLLPTLWGVGGNPAATKSFAVVALLASSIWPQVQVALLTLAWVLPPRLLAVRRRDRVLRTVVFLGKYGKFDAFVSALIGICMNVQVNLPIHGAGPPLGGVTLMEKTEWPGIAFALGHCALTAVTQVMLLHHERVVFGTAAFPFVPWRGPTARRWQAGLGLLAVATGVAFAAAVPLPLVHITFAGFYGYAFRVLRLSTAHVVRMSIFTTSFSEYFAVYPPALSPLLTACFTLLVVVAPMLHMTTLGVLWCTGRWLSPRAARALRFASDWLHPWSCADVAILAFTFGSLCMDQFAHVVSSPFCSLLQPGMARVTGEEYCMGLHAVFGCGWVVLAVACLLQTAFLVHTVYDIPEHLRAALRLLRRDRHGVGGAGGLQSS